MNLIAMLGLEGFVARWRANVIEGAIAVEDRMELASMEWGDQKRRLVLLAVLGIVAGGLTVIALIMLSLAILVTYWDEPNRTTVGWLLAGGWVLLWVIVLVSLAMIAKRAGNAFALTKRVLAQDWKYVKDQL
ncbi:phage holin family protein [Diaphorobacter aerolatus]|uniref:Phage holin family protein n=1 Tax=Diaphorobacter aerolatus TaxID=1288495 RepID=A0A7H0GKQ8_9BURK|nr:phage holin family protein [Diaphorobacter aerolatus]QNP48874.1 phage holin family protein [Diaphorobacter aerolatus]